MMGRSHALSGCAVGLAGGWLYGLPPVQSIFVGLVCGGAATLPDIDHPDSTVSATFGIVTQAFSLLVRKLAGGHRNGTHSAFGACLFALAAFAANALHMGSADMAMGGLAIALPLLASGVPVRLFHGPCGASYKSPWAALAATGFVVFTIVAALAATVAYGRIVGTAILGILLLLTLSALARAMRIPGYADEAAAAGLAYVALFPDTLGDAVPDFTGMDFTLIPWALLVGVVVHSMGDAITKGGVPWGWPLSQAYVGPQWIMTDGAVERRVILPALVVSVGAVATQLISVGVGVCAGVVLAWLLYEGTTGKAKKSVARRKGSGRKPAARKRAPAKKRQPLDGR